MRLFKSTVNALLRYLIWVGSSIVLGLIATWICVVVGSAGVEGSGVPEMKTIISGIKNDGYLKLRYFFGKLIALPVVLAGGNTL